MPLVITIPSWLIWASVVSVIILFGLLFYSVFTGFGKKP